jgi:hypothetical protein
VLLLCVYFSGVSAVDLSLVLTNIKVALLELVSTVVSVTPPATLFPVAQHVCRAVTAAISSRDMNTCPRFSSVVLQCAADVVASFPTAIVKTGMFTDVILSHFKIEMRSLTGLAQGKAVGGVWKSILTMQIVKQLLLFCGCLLTAEQRAAVEYCTAAGLACLAQGVCSSSCAVLDRKVRRAGSIDSSGLSVSALATGARLLQPMRVSLEAQQGLLQLATAEVLCPGAAGTLSGNVALLKQVAESLCSHPSAALRSEARLTLAVLDGLLHPTAIALPAVAAETLLRSRLAQRESRAGEGEGPEEAAGGAQREGFGAAVRDLYSAAGGASAAAEPAADGTAPAIAATTTTTTAAAAPAGEAMKAPFKATYLQAASGITAPAAADKQVSGSGKGLKRPRAESAESEDMELPDINLDA